MKNRKISLFLLLNLMILTCFMLSGFAAARICPGGAPNGDGAINGPTEPEEYNPLPKLELPEKMNRDSSEEIRVSGGTPPYSWSVDGVGVSLEKSTTSGQYNVITTDNCAKGTAEVTVTDSSDPAISISGEIKVVTSELTLVIDPDEMNRGESLPVSVIDGCKPFNWTISGIGFSLEEAQTNESLNTVYTDATANGSAIITVTDDCGEVDTGSVRCSIGQWVEIERASNGDPACGEMNGPPEGIDTNNFYYKIKGEYKVLEMVSRVDTRGWVDRQCAAYNIIGYDGIDTRLQKRGVAHAVGLGSNDLPIGTDCRSGWVRNTKGGREIRLLYWTDGGWRDEIVRFNVCGDNQEVWWRMSAIEDWNRLYDPKVPTYRFHDAGHPISLNITCTHCRIIPELSNKWVPNGDQVCIFECDNWPCCNNGYYHAVKERILYEWQPY